VPAANTRHRGIASDLTFTNSHTVLSRGNKTFWFNFLERKEDGTLADFFLGFSLGDATGDNIAKNEAERRPTREHFGAFWGPFGLILESF